MKLNINLSEEDWDAICAEDERSKLSEKQFWYKKRQEVIKRIEELDLNAITEKELLQGILMFSAKIYWESRKPRAE